MRVFSVAVFLLATVVAAKAQTYSGNELRQQCATNMSFVAGYIAGVTDKATVDEMLVTLVSVGEVHEKDQHAPMMTKAQAGDAIRGYCAPKGATIQQIADLYCKYLQDNPAQRQLTAVGLLDAAIKTAWPCK
jgi:hypothetical protein